MDFFVETMFVLLFAVYTFFFQMHPIHIFVNANIHTHILFIVIPYFDTIMIVIQQVQIIENIHIQDTIHSKCTSILLQEKVIYIQSH